MSADGSWNVTINSPMGAQQGTLNIATDVKDWAAEEGVDDNDIAERLYKASDEAMAKKAVDFGSERMRGIEKQILLQIIDEKWREHLLTLEHLRSVVGFRSYAQRDPLNDIRPRPSNCSRACLTASGVRSLRSSPRSGQ